MPHWLTKIVEGWGKDMMESMSTPATREEFERRMNLLREQMRQGKMHFSAHLTRTIDGLMRVRMLPNGRIDLLSIDESARLQANTLNQFANRFFKDELKAQAEQGMNSENTTGES